MEISLSGLANGQLEDKFQEALAKVLMNMTDVNTPYKTKREINIKLVFEQNEERNDIALGISVTPKLAPLIPVKTCFGVFRDLRSSQITVEEYGSHLRGQAMLPQEEATVNYLDLEQGGLEE